MPQVQCGVNLQSRVSKNEDAHRGDERFQKINHPIRPGNPPQMPVYTRPPSNLWGSIFGEIIFLNASIGKQANANRVEGEHPSIELQEYHRKRLSTPYLQAQVSQMFNRFHRFSFGLCYTQDIEGNFSTSQKTAVSNSLRSHLDEN
ncbi:unnamed protein product [Protopolystoma xenopodis]|uniref:Uncharacterized protein n=1 Tax=Protopolystoma xenopodis TaxID=117903 RepID=A0A3S5ACB1_9PLAT|nr:unnamed protein product [Protopolystoma xenopodis]